MKSLFRIAAVVAVFLAVSCRSINPILTDAYAADPSAIVFGDTLFVYPSHDQNAGIGFNMEDYHCYYTTDMKHFTDGGVIFKPLEQTTWVKNRAWGPQCVRKMVPRSDTDSTLVMRYFFYYSGNAGEIGVAVSDSPFGPFEDPLGKPFFTTDTPGIYCDRDFIDPHCFIDDDGQAYLFMGQNTVNAVKLNDDMISYDHSGGVLDENGNETGVYHIDAPNFFEAICCHKYNGKYYLSYANPYDTDHAYELEYCIGDSPLGPYGHKGKFMDAQGNFTNEHSIVEYKGQWWVFYHNAYVGVATGGGDQAFSRRSMCADRLYYNEDGTIKMVTATRNNRKFRKAVKTLTLPEFYQPVSQEEMEPVYREVCTPVKHGIVVRPENPDYKSDSPSVFRHNGKWYMTWIVFDGKEHNCIFDTGNSGGIVLKDKKRVDENRETDVPFDGAYAIAASGPTEKTVFCYAPNENITMDSYSCEADVLYVPDIDMDNVGMKFISRFDWIISPSFDKVYFRPRNVKEEPFEIHPYKITTANGRISILRRG